MTFKWQVGYQLNPADQSATTTTTRSEKSTREYRNPTPLHVEAVEREAVPTVDSSIQRIKK